MKRFVLALALVLAPAAASAQCNGVFPNNTVCGNITGSSNLPRPTNPSAFQGSAGGTNGQIQYNNGGALGGLTDTQVKDRVSGTSGGGTATFLRADGTWAAPPLSNAAQFGITCDGVTDDGPAFNTAYTALAGAPLVLPAGTCRIATRTYYNTWIAPGPLTVPGIQIIGQGREVTTIETDVANGYAISTNSAWAAVNKSMFVLTPSAAGGTLPSNTYWLSATTTDPGGNEIFVSIPKSAVVTGPTGSISLHLEPTDPGYTYNLYIGTVNPPANYARVAGVDAVGLAGNQTVVITSTGSAHAIPTDKRSIWQESQISSLSIRNDNATANASGLFWFRIGFSTLQNVYFHGLTGEGLSMPNWAGDLDGSFMVTVDKAKFDAITGWCLNAAGNTLEFSNFTVSNSFFNLCGTQPAGVGISVTMVGITNGNPGVVNTGGVPHNLLPGDQVFIANAAGMALPNGNYRVCLTVTAFTFGLCSLDGVSFNTTALGAYTPSSGVVQLAWRPPQMLNGVATQSGAIAYTGLISTFRNIGFTQNKNVNIYISEAGANDDITMEAIDHENTYGKGLYVATAIGLSHRNSECLSALGIGTTLSCIQLGTGMNKGGAQNITIDGMKVRTDVGASANGFEQFPGAAGLAYTETVSVKNVYWQTWLGGPTTKYVGFKGNPFPFFWAQFDGKTGATCTLAGSMNITSCVRNGVGDYTLTFTNPSLDVLYMVSGTGQDIGVAPGVMNVSARATGSTTIRCFNLAGALQDCNAMAITGFGNPQ